jgi:hypothetical protein
MVRVLNLCSELAPGSNKCFSSFAPVLVGSREREPFLVNGGEAMKSLGVQSKSF